MRHFFRSAAFVAAVLSSAGASAQDAPKGSLPAGKAMVEKSCYTCHGTTGQGGRAAPRIGPPAISFAAFIEQVRNPRNQMVPFPPEILSDQDVADIYAFLASQKKEDFKQIPLLAK